MKNIVVCCDGTGNEYGDRNTNVLKLFSVLPKNDEKQAAFYDPGVGTFSAPAAFTSTARFVSRVMGLAFGQGITKNIGDAYRFLMAEYEEGDQVFLFGFSRGAYTVRAVAALLFKCGLLPPRNHNLVPYALRLFKHEMRPEIYGGFRRTFSRRCSVHFLGLWDTVSSIGWIYNPLTLQFTRNNPLVKTVRHAVAIDEPRCFYRQNLWGEDHDHTDVKEVWFPGAHADVGGGYDRRESGLSQGAFRWMIDEAVEHGLNVDEKRLGMELPDEGAEDLERAFGEPEADPDEGGNLPPSYKGPLHRSLRGKWWIAEYFPRLYADPKDGFRKKLKLPRGRPRWIPDGSRIHISAWQRREDPDCGYDPSNWPGEYVLEPEEEGGDVGQEEGGDGSQSEAALAP